MRSPGTPPKAAPSHRDPAGHRHRGPAVALPGDDPRRRRQHGVRVHHPAKVADPQPGTRPAPELGRYDRAPARTRRAPAARGRRPRPAGPDPREPIAVLADVLDRDGSRAVRLRDQATRTWPAPITSPPERVWDGETRDAQRHRYRALVAAALPPPTGRNSPRRHGGCSGPCAPPSWPGWTRARSLTGHRRPRPRRRPRRRQRPRRPDPPARPPPPPPAARPLGRACPRAARPGPAGRPDRDRDHDGRPQAAPGRVRRRQRARLGGQRPRPRARRPRRPREWERKAASIGGYREMYGYHHPADPIGPEPSHDAPDQRAAWHEAFAALGPADGPDVRGMPDGRLWLVRDTYAAETAWAPAHVGDGAAAGPPRRGQRRTGRHPRRRRSRSSPQGRRPRAAPRGTRPWPPATGRCATATGTKRTPSP